jgi:hypothetical protein
VSNVRVSVGVSALIGLTLSVLLMLMATAPAQAQTVEDVNKCQAEIAALWLETKNVPFLGKNAAKANEALLLKLDNAAAKLGEGKYLDAIDKLMDFKNTVSALGAGKINPDDASKLIAGADEAIICVSDLQEQTPTATE